MSAIEPSVRDILFRNNVTEETLKTFASVRLPVGVALNLNSLARLYINDVLGEKIISKKSDQGVVKVKDLEQGKWASINVILVQKLETMSYFGCPTCNKGFKEMKEGEDAECPKCNKTVEVTKLYWPRYIAGDETGEVIVKTPVKPMEDDLTGHIVKLRGSLSSYRGNVEFAANKIDEDIALPSLKTSAPVGGSPAPTGDISTQKEADNPEMKALLERFSNFVALFIKTSNTDTGKLVTWFQKQSAEKGLNITVEQALDKIGYALKEGKLSKK